MKVCRNCGKEFKSSETVNGVRRSYSGRVNCLDCVPFGERPSCYGVNGRPFVKYTKELLQEATKDAISIAQVLRNLGLSEKAGGAYTHLQRRLQEFDVDTSHFKYQGWRKGIFEHPDNLKTRSSLREYTIRRDGYRCSICELSDWKGREISLELDHINGNRNDNREENLRILCPNCHSQTPTYRNKKRK